MVFFCDAFAFIGLETGTQLPLHGEENQWKDLCEVTKQERICGAGNQALIPSHCARPTPCVQQLERTEAVEPVGTWQCPWEPQEWTQRWMFSALVAHDWSLFSSASRAKSLIVDVEVL